MIHDSVQREQGLLGSFRSYLTALVILAGSATAHDIPADVTVHEFLKPAGNRLQLVVRVPLKAIRDVEFPESAGGYLEIDKLLPRLPDAAALWIGQFVEIREAESRLPRPDVAAVQISLESDRSFASFETAVAHVTGPKLAGTANVVWNQAMFDVLLEYPIRSDQSAFSIRPGLQHLGARVVTVLRFVPPGGSVRAFEFVGDPGLVRLDPRWHQAFGRFMQLGFLHIMDGTDHLLFLFCLVIPFRRFRPLLLVVTAFTAAHSFTLVASAYNLGPDALWFPPLIETLIAASIVYMALENIVGPTAAGRRWMIAFGFGLVHGFGFSFALGETLQFAGSHRLTSLVAFNIGVEAGQILVLVLLIPALEAVFRFVVAERVGTIILSTLVAHTGWHWMTERWDRLRQFRFEWPAPNAALWASVMRWAALLVMVGGAVWVVSRVLARARSSTTTSSEQTRPHRARKPAWFS